MKVVSKIVVKAHSRSPDQRLCTNLDDARSIISHGSDRSGKRRSRCLIEESIVLMQGKDISIHFQTEVDLK